MNVWVIENGQWDDREVVAIAASLEAAEKFIRENCSPDKTQPAIEWTVSWGELKKEESYESLWSLAGRFSTTKSDGEPSSYKDEWDITEWDVVE